MKNPFAGFKKKQVKLQFSTCGEIMIDGLPFAFGVESVGKRQTKGFAFRYLVKLSMTDVLPFQTLNTTKTMAER